MGKKSRIGNLACLRINKKEFYSVWVLRGGLFFFLGKGFCFQRTYMLKYISQKAKVFYFYRKSVKEVKM